MEGYTGRYGSHVWLGIPYAEPPVGERRWRAPAPPAAWSGAREALAFGDHCPQIASPFGGVTDAPAGSISGSEDCLYLNVYAPRMEPGAAAQAKLPVLVWIHGGGNVVGLADFYDGGRLAQSQDVIVVTLNYRLGPLGWFRHAALREGASPAEQSGNFATLDLVRALEWVRENAASFGGDPGNVTIFGESAGGTNVFTLLLSPLANGLFQRAIVQSGDAGMTAPAQAENFRDDRGTRRSRLVERGAGAAARGGGQGDRRGLGEAGARVAAGGGDRGLPAQPDAGAALRRLSARARRGVVRDAAGLRRRRRAADRRRVGAVRARPTAGTACRSSRAPTATSRSSSCS